MATWFDYMVTSFVQGYAGHATSKLHMQRMCCKNLKPNTTRISTVADTTLVVSLVMLLSYEVHCVLMLPDELNVHAPL